MAAPGAGRRRSMPTSSVLSLTVALIAAGVLLARAPEKAAGIERSTARVPASAAWPQVSPAELPRELPDGVALKPAIVVDTRTALLVAPTPGGAHTRLFVWRAAGGVREVRRVPAGRAFPFSAFTAGGAEIAWTEEARTAVGIWSVNSGAGSARRLATAGAAPADLRVADGRVHWAVPADDGRATELRSVDLAGGAVRVDRVDGSWTLHTWPWSRERRDGGVAASRLRNMRAGRDISVETAEDDLVTCGPVWGRVVMLRAVGPARIDIMRVDGTGRRTIDDTGADVATDEVALAGGRFSTCRSDDAAPWERLPL